MALADPEPFEQLVELRKVTERFPDGSVALTERLCEIWVPFNVVKWGGMCVMSVLSTDRSEELMLEGKQTMRRRKD